MSAASSALGLFLLIMSSYVVEEVDQALGVLDAGPRLDLSVLDATMLVMGGIVGTGIFVNPSVVVNIAVTRNARWRDSIELSVDNTRSRIYFASRTILCAVGVVDGATNALRGYLPVGRGRQLRDQLHL